MLKTIKNFMNHIETTYEKEIKILFLNNRDNNLGIQCVIYEPSSNYTIDLVIQIDDRVLMPYHELLKLQLSKIELKIAQYCIKKEKIQKTDNRQKLDNILFKYGIKSS